MYLDELFNVFPEFYPDRCKLDAPELEIKAMVALSDKIAHYTDIQLIQQHEVVIQAIFDITRTIKAQEETTFMSNQTSFRTIFKNLMQLTENFFKATEAELRNPSHLKEDIHHCNQLTDAIIAYLTAMKKGVVPQEFTGWGIGRIRTALAGTIGLKFPKLNALGEKWLPKIQEAYIEFQTRYSDSGISSTTTTPRSPTPESNRDELLKTITSYTQALVEEWNLPDSYTDKSTLLHFAQAILKIQDESPDIFSEGDQSESGQLAIYACFLSLTITEHRAETVTTSELNTAFAEIKLKFFPSSTPTTQLVTRPLLHLMSGAI